MSTAPPAESVPHSSSTSSALRHRTRNDTAGVNVKSGPALIAMNDWPKSSNETMSTSPDGVSWSVETSLTFESGKVEA